MTRASDPPRPSVPVVTGPARRALVTGASSGIGAAVAHLLAREGYRVALLARRKQALAELATTLAPATDGAHLVVPCDLTDPGALRTAFQRIGSEFGRIDLLVNNAGIGYRARVGELEPDAVRNVLETNVTGVLLCCDAALALLQRSERAVVVNIASVVGRRGVPGQAVYAASKAAVCSIGEALRIEWAPHDIAVCTLNPALTATGFFAAQLNPQGLPDPDLTGAAGADDVARHVLALDRRPRAERSLRWKWHLLGVLSLVWPRLADRLLVRKLGGGWQVPRR